MVIIQKARELLGKPLVTAVIGLLVGLIIGLPILGWGLMPVSYFDAAPNNLRKDLQQDYVRMMIDSYNQNPDNEQLKSRWKELGIDAGNVFLSLKDDKRLQPDSWNKFNEVLKKQIPGMGNGTVPITGTGTLKPVSTPTAGGSGGLNVAVIGIALGISCIFLIAIVGALVYFLVIKKRAKGTQRPVFKPSTTDETMKIKGPVEQYVEEPGVAPVAQFTTKYELGDDIYDDSFSIDAPSSEFLGECGVGISDTLGPGEPKKVTAFEVWLFDKNDIQTITKVLMSENAINDPAIHQKLEQKGEPILVAPGKLIELETATLRLEARIVDMNYGQLATPANSFLDRMTIDLTVYSKPTAEQA